MKSDEVDAILYDIEDAALCLSNIGDGIDMVEDKSSEEWKHLSKLYREMMDKWSEMHGFLNDVDDKDGED